MKRNTFNLPKASLAPENYHEKTPQILLDNNMTF